MTGRVIQGFFIGGAMRPQPAPTAAAGEARVRHPTGAPAPAFAGRATPLQARMAPGRPPLAHQGSGSVAQPHGGNGSFEIDPMRVGLAKGGGKPLPPAVLAKMEAAFGADFSAVRVHVGPQAARIGAIAFTTGNDLYFAPGRFQPDSVQGQQLIGHELAHVIQQRQGRVHAPGSGVAVVQDRALEAEADRLGMRAAMVQPRRIVPQAAPLSPGAPNPRQTACRGHGGRAAQAARAFKITGSATGYLNAVQGTTTASAKITWSDGTTTDSTDCKSAWQGKSAQWLWDIYNVSEDGRKHAHDAEVAVLMQLEAAIVKKLKASKAAFEVQEDSAEAAFNSAQEAAKKEGWVTKGATPKYKRKTFVAPTGKIKFTVSQSICKYCKSAIAAFCKYYGLTQEAHSIAD